MLQSLRENPYEPLFGHQLIQSLTQLQGSLGESSMDRTARRHNQSDAFYPSIISTSVRRALKKKLSAFSIFVETPVQPLKNISDIEGQDTSTYFFRSRGKKFEGFFPHLNRKSFFSLVVAKNKRFRGSKKLWRGNFFSS